MPVLPRPEEFTCAADLEIGGREPKARAEVAELLQRAQPAMGDLGQVLTAGDHEVAVRVSRTAPDPAAKLVQLREPEAVGTIDDDGVRPRPDG